MLPIENEKPIVFVECDEDRVVIEKHMVLPQDCTMRVWSFRLFCGLDRKCA